MNTPYPIPKDVPYTTEQVKSFFRQAGIPVAEWAKQNGYSVNKVYQVLNGQLKGLRGSSHEISIKLGLKILPQIAKQPTPVEKPTVTKNKSKYQYIYK